MSEIPHTTIRQVGTAPDGTPLYDMTTRSEEIMSRVEKEEIKEELVKQARLYRPIRWIYRSMLIASTMYAVAAITGHQLPVPATAMDAASKQTELALLGGGFGWFVLRGSYGNDIAKWEAKKDEFRVAFGEKISMIPERFHPRNLFKRR